MWIFCLKFYLFIHLFLNWQTFWTSSGSIWMSFFFWCFGPLICLRVRAYERPKKCQKTHTTFMQISFFHFMMHIITFMGWRYSCLKIFLMRSKSTVSKGQFLRLREFNPDWLNECMCGCRGSWLLILVSGRGCPCICIKIHHMWSMHE